MCDTTTHRLEEVWDGFVCAAGTDFLDCQPHLVGSVCTIIVIHCHFISIGLSLCTACSFADRGFHSRICTNAQAASCGWGRLCSSYANEYECERQGHRGCDWSLTGQYAGTCRYDPTATAG